MIMIIIMMMIITITIIIRTRQTALAHRAILMHLQIYLLSVLISVSLE